MQTPSASDPRFKAFLDRLQEQNNRGFLTQLLQLKAEREIAGEDGDKREEQLNEVVSSLNEVKVAVTGIDINVDITPLVNIGENQTRLLEELSRESALTRKLTEGSVEYDKAAAQYRNMSGRDIESQVTGKISKKGGFLDFETARSATAGQGDRARKANEIKLTPINYVPGKSVANITNSTTTNNETISNRATTIENKEVKSFFKYLGDEIVSGFKYAITDGLSEQKEKKDRTSKVSSARQKPVSANPESDNIVTSQEVIADTTKTDLLISNQLLEVTKVQLIELKSIREALAPKTPSELTSQKSTSSFSNEDTPGSIDLPGIPDFNFPRRTPTGPNKPTSKTPTTRAPKGKTPTTKIPGGASKLGFGLKVGGGLLAGAGLALGAYEASEFLDETGYGDKMKEGAGQKAEKAFRENVAPTIDPTKAGVTKDQAIAALENGSPRDIEKLGGREALMKIAGLAPVVGVSTEQAAVARSNYAAVDPRRVDTAGKTVASTSIENADMGREHLRGGGGSGSTIVSNNVSSTNTTKYVPMKASPRPEYSGSALDRYQSRITVY